MGLDLVTACAPCSAPVRPSGRRRRGTASDPTPHVLASRRTRRSHRRVSCRWRRGLRSRQPRSTRSGQTRSCHSGGRARATSGQGRRRAVPTRCRSRTGRGASGRATRCPVQPVDGQRPQAAPGNRGAGDPPGWAKPAPRRASRCAQGQLVADRVRGWVPGWMPPEPAQRLNSRSTRPALCSVRCPSCRASVPLTITWAMPPG
jgi:hypothetical protein